MAAPSLSLRSKKALDQLIQSYIQAAEGGGELMQMHEFEAAYFRDVVGSSPASSADIVSVPAFEQLLVWAGASLDMLRPELIALTYHLFVKSYVRMIQKAKYDEAKEFWLAFCPRFLVEHGEQMRDLAQLTSIEQLAAPPSISLLFGDSAAPPPAATSSSFLDEHPFVKCAVQDKVCLKMSSTGFSILKNFIVDSNLTSILSILNAEFTIDTDDTAPAASLQKNVDERQGRGDSLVQLAWRVPGKPQPHKASKRVRSWEGDGGGGSLQACSAPDISNDPFFSSLLDNVILPRLLASHSAEEVLKQGVELGLGLGDSATGQEEEEEEGQGAAEDVSPLPSVVFSTFTNTYGNMTCLHLTQDTKMAVAGFSDSSILVWDWGNDAATSSTSSCSFRTVLPTPRGQDSSPSSINEEEYPEPPDVRTTSKSATQRKKEGASVALVGHSQRVYAVSAEEYSGDNRLILSASADETVRLWDKRQATSSLSSPLPIPSASCLARYSCSDGIPWSVEFGPFGYHFLVGNQSGTAVLHSTDRLSALRVFRGHTSDVTCSNFHPNAAYVATGSDDGTVRLWDIRDASCGSVRRLSVALGAVGTNAGGGVTAVRCSPCGSLVAAGYEDGTAAVWDVPTGRLAYLLSDATSTATGSAVDNAERVGEKSIFALQFFGDSSSSQLVTGGQDCAVKLWDLSSPPSSLSHSSPSWCLLAPRTSFHTKFSPIFALSGFSSKKDNFQNNVIFAGGPSCLAS